MRRIYPCRPGTTMIAEALVEKYSHLAWRAMLIEVNLSPKPGLVDRINSGSHRDMTIHDFHRSADAIRPWLSLFIEYGAYLSFLPEAVVLTKLRSPGKACEKEMLYATQGVNTHKGTIFALGLLCAAIGRLLALQLSVTPQSICSTVTAMCHGITQRELDKDNPLLTPGQRIYRQAGLTGARGAAETGYQHVIDSALPHYLALLEQRTDPELALLDTLLLLMSINDDTNVVSRGGIEGLRWLQHQATLLLHKGGIRTEKDLGSLSQFDQRCIARHLSPGGSADLLIVTWFLAQIPHV